MFAIKEISANNIDLRFLKNELKSIAKGYNEDIESIKEGADNERFYLEIKWICQEALVNKKYRVSELRDIQSQINNITRKENIL